MLCCVCWRQPEAITVWMMWTPLIHLIGGPVLEDDLAQNDRRMLEIFHAFVDRGDKK